MLGAPKLMRLVKGVVGAVLAAPNMSSSSMAFSSIDSELFELVDMLPLRTLKVGGLEGEVPDRPRVVTESRRRPVSIGPVGCPGKPLPLGTELPRWKRLVRAAWVMEPRRLRVYISGLLLFVAVSVDILKEAGQLPSCR